MNNVKDFGAKGDGKTDDTDAVQATLDYLINPLNRYKFSSSGGTVFFPSGHYRISKTLDIKCPNVRLLGITNLDYVGRNCWIDYVGDNGPAIRLPKGFDRVNGFSIEDLLLVGRGKPGIHGIEISTGKSFRSGLKIKAGIFSFDIGVIVTKDKQTQIGFLTLDESNIRLNKQALVFTRPTSVNGFRCVNAQLSQNYKAKDDRYVLDLRIFGGVIEGCRLEGQKNPLFLSKCKNVRVIGNWYEGNEISAIYAHMCERVKVEGNYCYKEEDYVNKFIFDRCKDIPIMETIERILIK